MNDDNESAERGGNADTQTSKLGLLDFLRSTLGYTEQASRKAESGREGMFSQGIDIEKKEKIKALKRKIEMVYKRLVEQLNSRNKSTYKQSGDS